MKYGTLFNPDTYPEGFEQKLYSDINNIYTGASETPG